jgi:protein-S-isoprenylcysteine O-methyltransferase Ste14
MKSSVKHYLRLTILFILLLGIGAILILNLNTDLSFQKLLILLSASYLVALITSFVFFRGLQKKDNKGVLHTMSAIGIKFFLFLSLFGIFHLIFKELSWHFLVGYFGAYIAFTIILLSTFVNILKKKHQSKSDEKWS